MQRERTLDADAEGLLAHGERLAHAVALALDDGALVHLGALPAALDDLEMNLDGVARLEDRHVVARLFEFDVLNDRHGSLFRKKCARYSTRSSDHTQRNGR